MSGDGDFLSRWSRRKRQARRAEPRPAAEPQPIPEPDETAGGDGSAGEARAAEAPPPPDLPAVEKITAETDLAAFFREGVPEALRNAALRRMWSLDPAIRDFVGDARDYAYDWNVPGGVPGFGPLLPSDDVAGMVARLWGESGAPAGRPEVASPRTGASAEAPGIGADATEPQALLSPTPPEPEAESGGLPAIVPKPAEGAALGGPPVAQVGVGHRHEREHHEYATIPAGGPSRRHGSARPV